VVLTVLCAMAAFGVTYRYLPDYGNALGDQRAKSGKAVLDRKRRLLRIFPDDKGNFCLWRPIGRVPRSVRQAFVAAEDKRFYYHPGFDPVAVVRALISNVRAGKTVSGASTITQQVVRLIKPRPRTYSAKIVELLSGAKMEWQLSKEEILELYLNLSPTGGNIRGVALGAPIYFNKDISRLTIPEAALLAALPRSPSRFDPRGSSGRKLALAEKDRVLERMARMGWIEPTQLKEMVGSSVDFHITGFPLEAPHLVDFVVRSVADSEPVLETTVDLGLQHSVEKIVRSHRDRLAGMGIEQAGALVVSTDGPELLSMVGSMGYMTRDQGFNNATLAKRSAGSTLKPFLYGMALAEGFNASLEIPDTFRIYRTPHGDYLPFNADRRSYGPVSLRSALGNSLNISAVKLLKGLGVEEFFHLLKRLDLIENNALPAEHYGLGLAIGNLELSLYRLVQAFTTLARGGVYGPVIYMKPAGTSSRRVFSPEVAYVITSILEDPSARLLTFGNPQSLNFGFPVAVKTGTSTNYRDCWIVGYTTDHVIGIWAGNFSGRPNNGVTGLRACGPILKEIVLHLYGVNGPQRFPRPLGVTGKSVCWISGKPSSARCPYTYNELFIGESVATSQCNLEHDEDPYFYLGSPYARWLHRRENRQGKGRFRLGTPKRTKPVPILSRDASSMVKEQRAPIVRTSRMSIVSPHNLDRFVMAPHIRSRVRFRAVPDPLVKHVTWFLDGFEFRKTPPPYEFFWEPTRGGHSIHAVTPEGAADRIFIRVE